MTNALDRIKTLMGEEAFVKAEMEAKAAQELELGAAPDMSNSKKPDKNVENAAVADWPVVSPTIPTQATNQFSKERRQQARAQESSSERDRVCSALRRAQRYLGLRSKVISTMDNTDEPILDYNSVSRHTFDMDVVFISIDIEADETNHSNVTEVGVSILDTRKLHDLVPGTNGENWLSKIESRHIRIDEFLHIRNHQFVVGNPDGFNPEFGTSEFVSLVHAADLLHKSFYPERNVVLVGHSIKNDIRWLKCLGFDIIDLPNLVEVIATDDLQKALKHESRGNTNLGALLKECSIEASGLHNAGNDAAYTLQAMVVMTLQALSSTRPMLSLEERVEKAVRKAREQAETEWEAWIGAEMRSQDGREPVPYKSSIHRA